MFVLALILALALLIITLVALHYIRTAKRAKIKMRPLGPEQLKVLRACPSWELLNEAQRQKWKQHINIFLNEKKMWNSKTKDPLDISSKTEIAAQACLPLINRKTNYYGHINDIYYNPETKECSNAAEEKIEWLEILYDQFCKEISTSTMSREEFIQKSKKFFKGELHSTELRKFYQLNLPSSST